MSGKSKRIIKLVGGALVFFAPILVYILFFHGSKISYSTEDWGYFGDYVGGIYSVLVAILVIFLSRSLNKKDEKQKKQSSAAEEAYNTLQAIDLKNIDLRKVNKIFKVARNNKLYLPEDVYNNLINVANNLISAKNEGLNIETEKLTKLQNKLKLIYDY